MRGAEKGRGEVSEGGGGREREKEREMVRMIAWRSISLTHQALDSYNYHYRHLANKQFLLFVFLLTSFHA